ncbi:WD40-repeat-containing domain protein [Apiospora phragmitis]|uniref:WD40-repeat-containing domain protein n=1 Tax=Apiospora phragmitis TaxID=2905665 RepID=A0ABR1TSF9_9PEZI
MPIKQLGGGLPGLSLPIGGIPPPPQIPGVGFAQPSIPLPFPLPDMNGAVPPPPLPGMDPTNPADFAKIAEMMQKAGVPLPPPPGMAPPGFAPLTNFVLPAGFPPPPVPPGTQQWTRLLPQTQHDGGLLFLVRRTACEQSRNKETIRGCGRTARVEKLGFP